MPPPGVPLLPRDLEELRVILLLGLVFYVHHWNVSPEASIREISDPGQQMQLPEKSGKLGMKRNVLPNL